MGERAERLERRLERPMLVVAALVIPAIVLEESRVGDTWHTVASVVNWAIWLAFFAELVAMLALVRDRRGYLAHNLLSLAIVVLTPPFLPSLFQSLRALRLLRLARLLWLAPIFRLAFTLRGLQYASLFTLLVVVAGAAAYENAQPSKNYFDGVYWAVTTMTTVGYGDELPTTVEAKVIAMVLMLVGIGYFAVITGAIAERFIERGKMNWRRPSRRLGQTISSVASTRLRSAPARSRSSSRRCAQRSRWSDASRKLRELVRRSAPQFPVRLPPVGGPPVASA